MNEGKTKDQAHGGSILVDILVVLFLLIVGGFWIAPHFGALARQSPAIVCAGIQAACLSPAYNPEEIPPFSFRDEEAENWRLIASFRGVDPDSMCIAQYEVSSPNDWLCDPADLDIRLLQPYGTCPDEVLAILETKARLAFGSCEAGISQFVQAAMCEGMAWALPAAPDSSLAAPFYVYYI